MKLISKSVILTLLVYFCGSVAIEFTGSWLSWGSMWYNSLLGPFRLNYPLFTIYYYLLGLVVAFRHIRFVRIAGMVLFVYGSCWIAFSMIKYLMDDEITWRQTVRNGWDMLPFTLVLCTAFVGLNWHAFYSLFGRQLFRRVSGPA